MSKNHTLADRVHRRKRPLGRLLLRISPVIFFLLLGLIRFESENAIRQALWLFIFTAMIISSIFAAASLAIEWSQRVSQRWLPYISVGSAWITVTAFLGVALEYGLQSSFVELESEKPLANLTLVFVGLGVAGFLASGIIAIFSAALSKPTNQNSAFGGLTD